MQYASGFRFPPLSRFVKKLCVFLIAAFVLELLAVNFGGLDLFGLLALITASRAGVTGEVVSALGIHTLWQVVTYVLVAPPSPDGVMSLAFSLLFIWLIISPFEFSYGTLRTMQLCGLAVLAASLPAVLIQLLLPFLTPSTSILYGTFPITYAGMATIAGLARGGTISPFGLFTITSRQFLAFLVGFSVVMFLASLNLAMLVGSLGAIGAGVWFTRWMRRPPKRSSTGRKLGSLGGLKVVLGGKAEQEKPKGWLNRVADA
jgi:membrane associated rhomboid family serine protease